MDVLLRGHCGSKESLLCLRSFLGVIPHPGICVLIPLNGASSSVFSPTSLYSSVTVSSLLSVFFLVPCVSLFSALILLMPDVLCLCQIGLYCARSRRSPLIGLCAPLSVSLSFTSC